MFWSWMDLILSLRISNNPLPTFHLQGCSKRCHIPITQFPPLSPRHN